MTSLASKERILVVGNGMVGHHFVEQLHQANENAQITVLCGESRLAYDRVHLSSYFSGASAEDLALTDAATYTEWGVNFVTNAMVTDILRDEKKGINLRRSGLCVRQTHFGNGVVPLCSSYSR